MWSVFNPSKNKFYKRENFYKQIEPNIFCDRRRIPDFASALHKAADNFFFP